MPQATCVLAGAIGAIDAQIRGRAPIGVIAAALDASRARLYARLREVLGDSLAAKALSLKLLNLLLAKHHFLSRSTIVSSNPFGLVVDPANGCNLACPGCVHSAGARASHAFDWKPGMLEGDRFAALLHRYGPCAIQVMFCNYGEPTLNRGTPRLIELAKAYYAQTVTSTNLSLTRLDAEAWVRSGLDFMYLSIDGATQAVYQRYRRRGDLGVVFWNIRNLVAAKKRLGRRTPVLRWQFLAFEHNAHEIPLALETARGLGVDQFAVQTPFDVSWDDPDIRPATGIRPFCEEFTAPTEELLASGTKPVMTVAAAAAIERDFTRGWSHLANAAPVRDLPAAPHTCRWLYRNLVMDANGRILPCCAAPQPGMDLVFDTLVDGRADSFNTPHYQQAREHFASRGIREAAPPANVPMPYCAHCDWNQDETEVGPEEVAQYLRTAGKGAIDAASIEGCANW